MISKYNKFLNENVYKDEFIRLYNLAPESLQDLIDSTKEVQQGADWHPEGVVYIHIRLVTNRLANTYQDKNLNLAGFFHDIGKIYVTKPNGRGGWSAHEHEGESIKIVERYKTWIREQGGDVDIVRYVVANHMRYKYLDQMRIREQISFMDDVYFPYVQKFSTADYGGTELNCEPIDNHEYEKRKIEEFYQKEKEDKIIAKRFNAGMIMDKYPDLRKEKLGQALAGFKKRHEDFRSFILNNSTEDILKDFDNYMMTVNEGIRDFMTPISKEEVKQKIKNNPELYLKKYKEFLTDKEILDIVDGMNKSDKVKAILFDVPELFNDSDKKKMINLLSKDVRGEFVLGRFSELYTEEEQEEYWEDIVLSTFELTYKNGKREVNLDWLDKKWTKYSKQFEIGDSLYEYKGKKMVINRIESGGWYIHYLVRLDNTNESVRDQMTPKSKTDIEQQISSLPIKDRIDFISNNRLFDIYTDDEFSSYFKTLPQDELDSFLVYCVMSKRMSAIRILLDCGANPNGIGPFKLTPLYHAVQGSITSQPDVNVIKLLLDAGGDPTFPNQRGLTALGHAETWKKPEISELLKQYVKTNEGVRDMMTPKSDEDINKAIKSAIRRKPVYIFDELKMDYKTLSKVLSDEKIYNAITKYTESELIGLMLRSQKRNENKLKKLSDIVFYLYQNDYIFTRTDTRYNLWFQHRNKSWNTEIAINEFTKLHRLKTYIELHG